MCRTKVSAAVPWSQNNKQYFTVYLLFERQAFPKKHKAEHAVQHGDHITLDITEGKWVFFWASALCGGWMFWCSWGTYCLDLTKCWSDTEENFSRIYRTSWGSMANHRYKRQEKLWPQPVGVKISRIVFCASPAKMWKTHGHWLLSNLSLSLRYVGCD